jgi:hypothetical protein
MSATFQRFVCELTEHPGGYHQPYGRTDRSVATEWFVQRSITCLPSYLDFLSEVGPGRYFAGQLELFEVEPGGRVDRMTKEMGDESQTYFAIGYDGTTAGCYCLKRSGTEGTVYWCDYEASVIHPYRSSFVDWIEQSPQELFSQSVYAGYKRIKDIDQVNRVIEERRGLEVRLLRFDKHLIRPPKKENDFLPRYHRIVCEVRKNKESSLKQLTFKLRRTGSPVGADNVQYVTIDLPDFAVGQNVTVEAFAFDPFNVPFEGIVVDYSPEIDLGSPTRARFAELKPHL